jgi:hypothetical protein
MSTPAASHPSIDLDTLALLSLAHMEQEEAMLAATLDTLTQVRTALVQGDISALNQAMEAQSHTAKAAEELRSARAQLREQLACALAAPAGSVTLQALSARVPGQLGDRLRQCRERLSRMAAAVDRLNRGNAALIRQSLEFLHNLLHEITGSHPASQRYGPAGRPAEPVHSSLIEARG